MDAYIGRTVVLRSSIDYAGHITKVYDDGTADVSYMMPGMSVLMHAYRVSQEREDGSLAWIWMTPEEARDNPYVEPAVTLENLGDAEGGEE